jgi:hypothetical protein
MPTKGLHPDLPRKKQESLSSATLTEREFRSDLKRSKDRFKIGIGQKRNKMRCKSEIVRCAQLTSSLSSKNRAYQGYCCLSFCHFICTEALNQYQFDLDKIVFTLRLFKHVFSKLHITSNDRKITSGVEGNGRGLIRGNVPFPSMD